MARFAALSLSSAGSSVVDQRFRKSISSAIVRLCAWSLAILLVAGSARAQSDPAAGILPFSTHAGGQFDSIDLATGNIMLNIPVRSKTGKVPASFNLIGNFHEYFAAIGYPSFTSDLAVQPFPSTGGLGLLTTVSDCYEGPLYMGQTDTDYGFYVQDSSGASHSFGNFQVSYDSPCVNDVQPQSVWSGDGYTLVVTPGNPASGPPNYTVYDRDGNNLESGLDPDGTPIRTTSSQYVNNHWVITFFDTLGQAALTASSPSSSTDVYTYPGEGSGNPPQTLQVNWASPYPLRTVYGCPYDQDYNGSFNWRLPMSVNLPDGELITLSYEQTPGYPGSTTARLTGIAFSTGSSVSYAYSGGHHGIPCNGDTSTTLTRTVNDGHGHISTWTYTTSSPGGSTRTVTVTDPVGNITTYTFFGRYQTEQIVQDPNGNALSTTITCYNGSNTSQSACILPPGLPESLLPYGVRQTDVYTYAGNSAQPSLVETTYNNYLDVTSVKRYGVGATFPPSGTPVSETDTTYANINASCGPVLAYMFDRPCSVTTKNSSGATVAQTNYTYNAGGHPTQTSVWAGSSTYLNSSATYNSNGTIASSTDPNGGVTTYAYNGTGGCNGMLPTSTTLPQVNGESFQMSSSQTWDCVGGVVTSSTDANGRTTSSSYNGDPFWRPTR